MAGCSSCSSCQGGGGAGGIADLFKGLGQGGGANPAGDAAGGIPPEIGQFFKGILGGL